MTWNDYPKYREVEETNSTAGWMNMFQREKANNLSSYENPCDYYGVGTPKIDGDDILSHMSISKDNIGRNFGILVALAVGLRVIAYLILTLKYASKKYR